MRQIIQILTGELSIRLWQHALIVVALLGAYLSVVIIISNLLRYRANGHLGLYLAGLSIVLFSLEGDVFIPENYQRMSEYAAAGALCITGPSMLQLIHPDPGHARPLCILLQVACCIIFIIMFVMHKDLTLPAMVYTGGYLIYSGYKLYRRYVGIRLTQLIAGNKSRRWRIGFYAVASFSYILILIALLINKRVFSLVISFILSLNILFVWIRLLATSHYTRLYKKQ